MLLTWVFQDNVLASEVSLHDLNSLHDGTNRDGPLRLRLRCSPFRFMTRYYALREQIYRLDLAEGGTTYDAEQVTDPYPSHEGTSLIRPRECAMCAD